MFFWGHRSDHENDEVVYEQPVPQGRYSLDGRPEIIFVVNTVYEDTSEVDGSFEIKLPTGSTFISIQFLPESGGNYNDHLFQVTYRQADGKVCSCTYNLMTDDGGTMTIMEGMWTISGNIRHVFIDKESD